MWPDWRLWTCFAVFMIIGTTPLVKILIWERHDRRAVDRIRATLRRTGWTLIEVKQGRELWGRTLTPEQQRVCVDNRFVIPHEPSLPQIQALERDLERLVDDPRVVPTGFIRTERLLSEDELTRLRTAFLAKQGLPPQFGAEIIKLPSETPDQDGET